jgi:hypothetical protein
MDREYTQQMSWFYMGTKVGQLTEMPIAKRVPVSKLDKTVEPRPHVPRPSKQLAADRLFRD